YRRDRRLDRVPVGRRGGAGPEDHARVSLRGVSRTPRRLTRGIVAAAILAIAVRALVVAWGDAPAVLGALSMFPPVLVVRVGLLTTWNYVLRWLRWNYYLRVLGVSGIDSGAS